MANQPTTEKRKQFGFLMNETEKQMLKAISEHNYFDYADQIRKLIRDEYNRIRTEKRQTQALTAVAPESR